MSDLRALEGNLDPLSAGSSQLLPWSHSMGGQSGHSAFRMLTHAELCQLQGFPVVGLGDHE